MTLPLLSPGDSSLNSPYETDIQTQEETRGHFFHQSNKLMQREKQRDGASLYCGNELTAEKASIFSSTLEKDCLLSVSITDW